MDETACWRFQENADCVGDTVIDAEKTGGEMAEAQSVIWMNIVNFCQLRESEFFESLIHKTDGEACAVDRWKSEFFDEIGDRSDVIEMTVRQENSTDVVFSFDEI